MNVLILTANDPNIETSWQKELKEYQNINVAVIYKYQSSYLKRGLRKLHRLLPIPGYQVWCGEWWNHLADIDVIIAIAYDSTYRLFKMIKKRYPHIRRILYWWDPVPKTISPDKVSEEICEKWTFSKRDAKQYRINYNSQFFAHAIPILNDSPKNNVLYDIMFFGAGGALYIQRVKMLVEFHSVCEKLGLKTCFGIKYSSHKNMNDQPFAINEVIGEDKYTEILQQSKAMLDLTEPGQEWMTLRPVEALFYHKKLITNNLDIADEPLYDPQNVFLLGKDSYDNLKDFLEKPIKEMPQEVFDYYSTSAWLERFKIDE